MKDKKLLMFFFQDRRQTANLPEYEGEFPGFSARVYQIIVYYFFNSEKKILRFQLISINFDLNSIFYPEKLADLLSPPNLAEISTKIF